MYDSLDKIGLKAVLEAIKGKIPTSLPANGGNADTVDGKHAENFIYPRAMLSNVDLNTILYPCSALIYGDCTNMPPVESWGTLLCYSGGTGSHVQLWATATDSSMFKRHYDGVKWSDWKEISTTPIRSTTFSATADGTGNFNLWAPSENKVPISIQLDNKTFYAVPFLYNNQVWLGSTINEVTRQPVTNTTVSGTVYYIEI